MSREKERDELIHKLMSYLIDSPECSKYKCSCESIGYLQDHVANSVDEYFDKTIDWLEEEADACDELQNSVFEVLNYLGPSLVNVMIVYIANLYSFSKYFKNEADVYALFYEVAKFMVENKTIYNGKKSVCYRSIIEFYCKKFDEKKEAA